MEENSMIISDRLRELRRRRGLTQEDLAERAKLSLSVVKKIEGGRSARMETYHQLARALGVQTMVFVAPTTVAPEPALADDRDLALTDLRAAIVPPLGPRGPLYPDADEGEPNLSRLTQASRSLFVAYHGGNYNTVAELAPGLIRSAHFHVEAVREPERRNAVRLRGDLLGLTGRYLVQIRAHDLALIALRDALRDATEAGDQALAVMTISGQAWVMLRQARFAEVERLCSTVATDIEPRLSTATDDELGAWGRMLLRASSAAARNNRPVEARDYLSVASGAAARLGSEQPGHESFGPVAAKIQGAENELIGGHPDLALNMAAQLLPGDVQKANRAKGHRHLLDRARSLVQTGQHEKASDILTSLRHSDPAWLRHQDYARNIVRDLLAAPKRMPNDAQRKLAAFMGVED